MKKEGVRRRELLRVAMAEQRGWRAKIVMDFPGAPAQSFPSCSEEWPAVGEGCVPHGRQPVESWGTQPHGFVKFGVWSIFVFLQPSCLCNDFLPHSLAH